MDQIGELRKALFGSAQNQSSHGFSSSTSSSPHTPDYARTVPVITRILIRHGMLPEIDHLVGRIIDSEASRASPLLVMKSLASSGF
ncbi:hypothetical protein MLD38_026855 [Melastoma candidum]|uniref:Uncharacterized protein n=1 Tax=Melastoma candidum TaxID=119954 RepID=A0ACB9P3C1_9MYRT|nr:hypothetical protein MLD38_026855 [Melastoma candidum]